MKSQSMKPFCSVCKSAGKTESEYTNHYTKSSTKPDAVVTCPTILNSNCSYCKSKGHFKSKCPSLKEKEMILQSQKKEFEKEKYKTTLPNNTVHPVPIVKNIYNILNEEVKPKEKKMKTVEYPLLPSSSLPLNKTKNIEKNIIISYAEKLSMNPNIVKEEELNESMTKENTLLIVKSQTPIPIYAKKLNIVPEKNSNKNINHSWDDDAYWNDDDDEDEDEDEYDTNTTNTRNTDDTYDNNEFYEKLGVGVYNDPFWSV